MKWRGFSNMTRASRYRGFFSLDALFCIVPVLLLSLMLVQASSELAAKAERESRAQQLFDKLVSAADHTVKSGGVVGDGIARHPNWIDEAKLTPGYAEGLRSALSLSELHISLSGPEEGHEMCIYRLVVAGKEKRISRLHVCGG